MTDRSPRITQGSRPSASLGAPLADWQAAVVRLSGVDPITTELVRIRCAVYHDCRT